MKTKDLSYQVKASQKLLAVEGFTFRLATMQEKRALARDCKKRNYLPCSYGRPERKALRDVYDNFKKDVWAVFFRSGGVQFWSSRNLVKYARQMGRYARNAKPWNVKNFRRQNPKQIVVESPLEDSEFYAGGTRDTRYEAHLCQNCPENIDWREYKAQNQLTNE